MQDTGRPDWMDSVAFHAASSADQDAADEQGGNAEVHFLLQRRRTAEAALGAALAAHAEAEAAEVRARATYEAVYATKIKVIRDPHATPEALWTARAAYDQARAAYEAAFTNYAASARSLSQARALTTTQENLR